MGFWVTTLIFLLAGVAASLFTLLCCNRGPSTNLYVPPPPSPSIRCRRSVIHRGALVGLELGMRIWDLGSRMRDLASLTADRSIAVMLGWGSRSRFGYCLVLEKIFLYEIP
jgi:hypothetical protein